MAEAITETMGPGLAFRRETPESQALKGLEAKIGRIKERVSFSDLQQRLKSFIKKDISNDPEIEGISQQLWEVVDARLRKEEDHLKTNDLPRVFREMVGSLLPGASLEGKEQLQELLVKLSEFEARGVMGELSPDPQKAFEQLSGLILGKEDGEQFVNTMTEVAAATEKPYPKPKPPSLPTGEKGFFGKGKGPGLRYYRLMVIGIALMTCCAAQGACPGLKMYLDVRGRTEADSGTEAQEQAGINQAALDVVDGRYPYEWLERSETLRGEEGEEFARSVLERTRDLVMADPNRLDQMDAAWIGRLIHEYGEEEGYNLIFNLDQVDDLEKRDQVSQYLSSGRYESSSPPGGSREASQGSNGSG